MSLAAFIIAGIAVVLIAEAFGRLHITSFDVSHRFADVRKWRRAQVLGIILLPGVFGFWAFILRIANADAFSLDCTSWTRWTFAFGMPAFVLTICWARLVAFTFVPKHWQEVARIIEARRQDQKL